ncbi:MAG: hypothetical protein JXK05_09320 [Campylobacterales bacterium]|nr:hypothetical protein [Campylobacterales bacterium]
MKLQRLIDHLYDTIYIAIVDQGRYKEIALQIGRNSDQVQMHRCSNQEELEALIDEAIGDSPYFYIALLNNMADQGALPTCDRSAIKAVVDVTLSVTLCMNNAWMLYSAKGALDLLRERHGVYGLDYIFSPFSLLQRFFADKIGSVWGLFVLVQEESVAVAVFSSNRLEYARFMTTDESEIALMEASASSTFEFDHQSDASQKSLGVESDEFDLIEDIDTLEGFEGFDDIEELDDLDSIESFGDFEQVEEAKPASPVDLIKESTNQDEGFNLDYHRFTLLQSALSEYYADVRFHQEFVEAVFVADAVGLGGEFKLYIEEELFMTPIIRHIELPKELLRLCKEEVRSAS